MPRKRTCIGRPNSIKRLPYAIRWFGPETPFKISVLTGAAKSAFAKDQKSMPCHLRLRRCHAPTKKPPSLNTYPRTHRKSKRSRYFGTEIKFERSVNVTESYAFQKFYCYSSNTKLAALTLTSKFSYQSPMRICDAEYQSPVIF
jgi:hypothetical protein